MEGAILENILVFKKCPKKHPPLFTANDLKWAQAVCHVLHAAGEADYWESKIETSPNKPTAFQQRANDLFPILLLNLRYRSMTAVMTHRLT